MINIDKKNSAINIGNSHSCSCDSQQNNESLKHNTCSCGDEYKDKNLQCTCSNDEDNNSHCNCSNVEDSNSHCNCSNDEDSNSHCNCSNDEDNNSHCNCSNNPEEIDDYDETDDICDLDSTKICDNCCLCLDQYKTDDKGFVKINIDGVQIDKDKMSLEELYKLYGLDED